MKTVPIVGAYYRPPAKALIAALPVGNLLIIRAEPENPVDPNAIAVFVRSDQIPDESYEALGLSLQGFGFTVENIKDQEEWQLGYVPKELAAELRAEDKVQPGADLTGIFRCSASGSPQVVIPED